MSEFIYHDDNDGTNLIFEMANISPQAHKFGVNLKMHILQPGDRQMPHGPRVKFFRHVPGDGFSISLNQDVSKIGIVAGVSSKIATVSDVNKLIDCVKKYRIPLLNMWSYSGMSQDELLEEMAEINAGKTVRLRSPE